MSESDRMLSRRRLLKYLAASLSAASTSFTTGCATKTTSASRGSLESTSWNAGDLRHLIPAVNHQQILIKLSFNKTLNYVPKLRVNERKIGGVKSDNAGRFWQFHVNGLTPSVSYDLQLENASGLSITDSWSLKTFPHPDQHIERLRVMAYTCAGGNDTLFTDEGIPYFLDMSARHRLLDRGLSFSPDLVVANGDHIYWDQKTVRNKPAAFKDPWLRLFEEIGTLDANLPPLSARNEAILKRIVDPQIADLYGVRFRSTPVFMLTDDHDLFENDEANEEFITLPPEEHRVQAARATQYLYYPEFLPDINRPGDLPGSSAIDREKGLSEVFGTIRYGNLFEALLYDTKRYNSVDGASALIIPRSTEQWLSERAKDNATRHLIHIPSTPIGWSAGKWGEWYPDVRQSDGSLGKERAKPYWPSGWWSQHQRIIGMLSSQTERTPVIASGDLHALAYGLIESSGDMDLSDNPIHSVCVGPLASSGPGFPSQYRGIGAQVPSDMRVNELLKPIEKNGFSILDISRDEIHVKLYAWRPPEPLALIDRLEPMFESKIPRNQ